LGRPRKTDDTERSLAVDYGDNGAVFTPRDLQGIIEAPLDSKQQQKADQARVRKALMVLAKGNVHRVQAWLDAVANDDPGRAIDLWLKMLKFTVPELRAVAVEVTDDRGEPAKMSIQDLEAFLRERHVPIEGEVVSEE
jgi:hypothetical protein